MTAKKRAVGANHATGIKENIDPGKLVRSYRPKFSRRRSSPKEIKGVWGCFTIKRKLPILTAIRIACPVLRVQCPACADLAFTRNNLEE